MYTCLQPTSTKKEVYNGCVYLLLINGCPHKLECKLLKENNKQMHNAVRKNQEIVTNNTDLTRNATNSSIPEELFD